MSGERVTDERLEGLAYKPWLALESRMNLDVVLDLATDLKALRGVHRETEAKLTAALALAEQNQKEADDMRYQRDYYRQVHRRAFGKARHALLIGT